MHINKESNKWDNLPIAFFVLRLITLILLLPLSVQALRSAKTIELRNIQRGKYFRILADVYIDGKSLADSLIKTGHARTYDGSKRLGWCN